MNKVLVFFFFIVFIIITTLILLYTLYEKPKQEDLKNIPQIPITIYVFDKYNNTQVITGVQVLKNNELISNYSSVIGGGLFLNVSVNNTYIIKTFNLDKQNYYTEYTDKSYFGSNFAPQRIDLYISQPGDLGYKVNKDIIYGYNNLTLYSLNRDIKNVSICVKWSIDFISINIQGYDFNLTRQNVFDKYNNFDKCFYIGTLTNSTKKTISIVPIAYIDLKPYDYVDVMVIDSDCYKNNCVIDNGNDIGMKDVEIMMNITKIT